MTALQTECAVSAPPASGAGDYSFTSSAAVATSVHVDPAERPDRNAQLSALKILIGDDPALRLDRRRLPGGCTSANCIADAVFGRGVGARLIHLLVRYGYNASPTAAPGAQPWTAAQLDEIITVFAAIPPTMFRGSLANARPLVLVPTPPASRPIVQLGRGDHGIRLASLWSLYDRQARRGVLLHEFAHNLRAGLAAEAKDPSLWLAAARPQEQVSEYARWSDDEDFAESFVAFLQIPTHLKAASPERYEYMRQHIFNGTVPACPAKEPLNRIHTASIYRGASAALGSR